jgi:hypothetical protein
VPQRTIRTYELYDLSVTADFQWLTPSTYNCTHIPQIMDHSPTDYSRYSASSHAGQSAGAVIEFAIFLLNALQRIVVLFNNKPSPYILFCKCLFYEPILLTMDLRRTLELLPTNFPSTRKTWSDNKFRKLIAVKVLHTSLLKTTVVAFKVLPLGS